MIIEIPGREPLNIKNIVLDYNGTLADSGIIPQNVKNKLQELANIYTLYILTADTYGNVAAECEDLPISLKTFTKEDVSLCKKQVVESLIPSSCACIGNGFNDIEMFKIAGLSVGIIGPEGACAAIVPAVDILANNIDNALDLFLNTKKISATLRS